jgi:hypothetical protein
MEVHVLFIIHQQFFRSLAGFTLSAPYGSAGDGLGLRITTSCISHIYMCHIRRSDRSCGPIDLDPQGLIKRHWASALDIGILSYGSVVEGTGVTR